MYLSVPAWLAYLAVALQLAIAVVVYRVDARAPTHRTFAVFIALNAVWDLGDILSRLAPADHAAAWDVATHYVTLPTTLALLAFSGLLLARPTWLAGPWARRVLGAVAVFWMVALLVLRPAWPMGDVEDGSFTTSWRSLGDALWYPGLAVAAFLLTRRDRDLADRAIALGLLAYPLGSAPYLVSALQYLWPYRAGLGIIVGGDLVLATLATLLAIATAAWLAARHLRDGFGWLVLFVATALVGMAYLPSLPDALEQTLSALPALVFSGLIGYAVLRGRLFDIDLRLVVGLHRATFVAAVGLSFVLLTAIAGRLAPGASGTGLGVLAAVLVALAVRPVQIVSGRFVDRLAAGLDVTPATLHARKQAIYAEAVRRGERERRLHALRVQLSLDMDDAMRIEHDVHRQTSG